MTNWKVLSLFSVIGVGVLSFLRIVANEILAVEKQLKLLEIEEAKRRGRAEKWGQAV